jgi:hypothetical protein
MRKYFWRQLSTLWFDRYLTLCGAVLNALAVFGLIAAAVPDSEKALERRYTRARVELENGPRCDQLMANSEFAPGRGFEIRISDGTPLKMNYKDKGANTSTKEGHQIHMVEMDRVGFLFFEVDDKKIIRRCVPAAMLECVTAEGSFDKDGECIVAVNLPSDCEVMKGVLLETGRCRVPAGGRVLKPSSRVSGKVCSTPDCVQ